MNTQLLLDYPVWRLSWSGYGELKGLDLSQTESACDWFDHDRIEDMRDNARLDARAEYDDQREFERNVDYQPAPDEERDFYINDYDAGSATDE